VKYDDHVAAVAEAEQRTLQAARDAVAALNPDEPEWAFLRKDKAVAAIDALKGEQA